MAEFSLEGKVAIITGASRGIGRAIALRLAMAGARVVVCCRKLESVQAVAGEITAAGGQALAISAHVGQPEDVQALVARTLEAYGRVAGAYHLPLTELPGRVGELPRGRAVYTICRSGVRAMIAAFETLYSPMPGEGRIPTIDARLMILPPPWASM